MALGTPVQVMTSDVEASGSANNVVTLGADVGTTIKRVVLIFACRDTSVAGVSVSDSKGNTWSVDANPNSGGTPFGNNLLLMASTAQDGGRLLTGDTITVHFTTAPNLDCM